MTDPVKTIAQVIAEHDHDFNGNNGGGILATCTCGAVYDWLPDHQQEMILKECFPHLTQLHADLLTSHSGWLSKQYYQRKAHDYEALEEELCEWAGKAAEKPDQITENLKGSNWYAGYQQAAAEVENILQKHDV